MKKIIFLCLLSLSVNLLGCEALAGKETAAAKQVVSTAAGPGNKTGVFRKTEQDRLPLIQQALREVMYCYYMRGANVQYNSMKRAVFSPEEATGQNMNYMVCSALSQNIYKEALGLAIPSATEDLLEYSKVNMGRPEVLCYAHKDAAGNLIMHLYDPAAAGHSKTVKNPRLSDILPYLQCGDVLTYTGHTVVVYDLLYDAAGNVTDALVIQSAHGDRHIHVKTKIPKKTAIGKAIKFGSANHFLYHNSRIRNVDGKEMTEGSYSIVHLSGEAGWSKLALPAKKKEYSVLRFAQTDANGKAVLYYRGASYGDRSYEGEPVRFSDVMQQRLKFRGLYIEKTVDAHADNVAETGDTLTYTIKVKNNSSKNYAEDLQVTDNISEFVECKDATVDGRPKQLVWNIGKLKSGEEVQVRYAVTVKSNTNGKLIVSTGKVGSIPSATVKNPVGTNLKSDQTKAIKDTFAALQNSYQGKALINEVYKQALGMDLQLDRFDITELIKNTNPQAKGSDSLMLNTAHRLYPTVLNKYWNTLSARPFTYRAKGDVIAYDLKKWGPYGNPARRADTVYGETFKTGDILIYTNTNDVTYEYKKNSASENKLLRRPVTFEDGEYAYIFIEGKGFLGINYGRDGVPGTQDDRNDFTPAYYVKHNLQVYSNPEEKDGSMLEFANYQTLLGKDYYVILRPSLGL